MASVWIRIIKNHIDIRPISGKAVGAPPSNRNAVPPYQDLRPGQPAKGKVPFDKLKALSLPEGGLSRSKRLESSKEVTTG
jgi:hypothetical protein